MAGQNLYIELIRKSYHRQNRKPDQEEFEQFASCEKKLLLNCRRGAAESDFTVN